MDNIRAGGYTLFNIEDIITNEKYLQHHQKTGLHFNRMPLQLQIREF